MALKKLNINNYYFHSIIRDAVDAYDVIGSVLEDKGILPSYKLDLDNKGFNNNDEICISRHTKFKGDRLSYISCLDIYIPRLISFIIDNKGLNIYKPVLVKTNDLFNINTDNKIYTNLFDEYRTKDIIPIDYIKGISIPYKSLISDPYVFLSFIDSDSQNKFYNGKLNELKYINILKRRKEFMDKYIYSIEELIKQSNIDLPIYYYDERKLVLK